MSFLTYLTITFAVLFIAMAAMTVGLWFGRSPIKGSCGGIGTNGSCATCGNDPAKCDTGNQSVMKPNVRDLV